MCQRYTTPWQRCNAILSQRLANVFTTHINASFATLFQRSQREFNAPLQTKKRAVGEKMLDIVVRR
jgi:hypothetical protein